MQLFINASVTHLSFLLWKKSFDKRARSPASPLTICRWRFLYWFLISLVAFVILALIDMHLFFFCLFIFIYLFFFYFYLLIDSYWLLVVIRWFERWLKRFYCLCLTMKNISLGLFIYSSLHGFSFAPDL